MHTRIEIYWKPHLPDPQGEAVLAEIRSLGILGATGVRVVEIYYLLGSLSIEDVEFICKNLLVDGIVQDYTLDGERVHREDTYTIEVARKPGVMDPVEHTTIKGINDLGIEVQGVKRSRRHIITGSLSKEELSTIASKVLANTTVDEVSYEPILPFRESISGGREYAFKKITVPIIELDDERLMEISKRRSLSLNLEEMKAIQKYFGSLGREPTDAELETIAQTWSEHCIHKTLRGLIEYREADNPPRLIDNLLQSTIMLATHRLKKPWCVSVFKDNAGIIRFDSKHNICFKVETHNHPSAIEPYGGASTGVGGVIRDCLGTGLGARPILNTDVFCFGPPDYPYEALPKGVLHPRRVFKGVVAGVRDYGNRMGIPTANGSIFFDERYVGNPLVFCGNVGLIPRNRCKKGPRKGDLIVLLGGRTGRDGIHGATFSSAELTQESERVASTAVQIGDPITEKKITDVLLQARDRALFNSITDCGAGGLSSAVGEMGRELGAEVELDKVPLKYKGLSYWEVWVSEAQERMVLSVPERKAKELMDLFASENAEATVIGRFTSNRKLCLKYQGQLVGELDMGFLHNGLPRIVRKARWVPPRYKEPNLPEKEDYGEDLKKILSSWNVCSKEWVIRQYDHEVQGGTILKPLQGINNDGPGDACVVLPILGSRRGIIVSNGMNPRYGDIDPYHMAASAIDEALRQIVAVGGNLLEVALLDNFCWGNTSIPDRLGSLVRAATACYDIALRYGTPFISGKDSLNNEFNLGDRTISIPPTLLISAIAVVEDVKKIISMDLKLAGNLIYITGLTRPELGGSHFYMINGFTGNQVPKVEPKLGKAIMEALAKATGKGLVRACHDLSEGGLAVAAAEMSFAGGLGLELYLACVPTEGKIEKDYEILFSESNSRFLVEVSPENKGAFEGLFKGLPLGLIGKVTGNSIFSIKGRRDRPPVIQEDINHLKEAWQRPLKW